MIKVQLMNYDGMFILTEEGKIKWLKGRSWFVVEDEDVAEYASG